MDPFLARAGDGRRDDRGDVRSGRTVGQHARQRGAESVHHGREPLQAARGPHVGLDQRGGHRSRWQVDLGGRALRRQQLLRPRQGDDVAAAGHPQVRRVWKAGAQFRDRHRRSSRTASTSTAKATCGSPTARTTSPRRAPNAPADAPLPPAPAKVIGHQVFKFSPDGKLLLTLGKPGGNQLGQPADPASFYQPNDVITYPNGDILVAEGHGNAEPTPARLSASTRAASSCASSASSAPAWRASSCSRTGWPSIRRPAVRRRPLRRPHPDPRRRVLQDARTWYG